MIDKQYFILNPAVDTPETGNVYPAVESFDDYDFNKPNSVHKLNSIDPPELEPDIRFKISKGAKVCDLLSQATINAPGLLINEKTVSLFKTLKIASSRLYPAQITFESKIYNYFWIQFNSSEILNLVDFNNSLFKFKISKTEFEHCNFQNADSFSNKRKELGFFNPIIPVKLFSHKHDLDLFVHPIKNIICASSIVQNLIRNNSLTGFKFENESKI